MSWKQGKRESLKNEGIIAARVNKMRIDMCPLNLALRTVSGRRVRVVLRIAMD